MKSFPSAGENFTYHRAGSSYAGKNAMAVQIGADVKASNETEIKSLCQMVSSSTSINGRCGFLVDHSVE